MTTQPETYLTPEVMALIGVESEMSELSEPISPSEVRRFTQAIMDPDPIYWNEELAKQTRYRGLVVPPLFPGFVNRRPAGTSDPLDGLKENPDLDGTQSWRGAAGGGRGLPPVRIPLVRILNGGVEAEFFQYAKPGDRIKSNTRYANISERRSGSTGGMMVFVVTETNYYNQDDVKLATIRNTIIHR